MGAGGRNVSPAPANPAVAILAANPSAKPNADKEFVSDDTLCDMPSIEKSCAGPEKYAAKSFRETLFWLLMCILGWGGGVSMISSANTLGGDAFSWKATALALAIGYGTPLLSRFCHCLIPLSHILCACASLSLSLSLSVSVSLSLSRLSRSLSLGCLAVSRSRALSLIVLFGLSP